MWALWWAALLPSTGKAKDQQHTKACPRAHTHPSCPVVAEVGTALTKKNLGEKGKGPDLWNLQSNRNM